MITQFLGILDLAAGIVLFSMKFISPGGFFSKLAFILAFYLIIKAVIFFSIITTVMDVLAAIFLVLAAIGIFTSISWVFVLWLIQKAFFSVLTT